MLPFNRLHLCLDIKPIVSQIRRQYSGSKCKIRAGVTSNRLNVNFPTFSFRHYQCNHYVGLFKAYNGDELWCGADVKLRVNFGYNSGLMALIRLSNHVHIPLNEHLILKHIFCQPWLPCLNCRQFMHIN